MAKTIYRIMGKRGRITIPYEFRQRVGFGYNDVLSFTHQEDGSVLVKRERVCDECRNHGKESSPQPAKQDMSLMDLLNGLSPVMQQTALMYLSFKLQDHTALAQFFENGGGRK